MNGKQLMVEDVPVAPTVYRYATTLVNKRVVNLLNRSIF